MLSVQVSVRRHSGYLVAQPLEMAAVGAEGPEVPALAQLESFDDRQPATPRTPKSGGMTLRSGNTPRRTPLRNSITRGLTPRRTPRRSPRIKAQQQHLSTEDALALEFGEAYSGFLDNIDEFVTSDPSLIEVSNSAQWPQLNILQMSETGKFSSFNSKDNPFFGSVSSPALHKMGHTTENQGSSHSAVEGYLTHQHFTGAGLSPVLAGKLMSPGIDLTRLRRKTGLTPRTTITGHSVGGVGSPRLGPFPSPSPYRLRSASPRSSFLAREADVAALGMGDSEEFYKPRGSAKRPLLTDPPLYLSPSSKHTHLQPSSTTSNTTTSIPSSAKKMKKTPKPKRTTSSAPKRGEYRCGKCGFFPKKSKHNCLLEKAKRQNSGQSPTGNNSGGPPSSSTSKSQDDPLRNKMTSDPMLSFLNSNH